MANVLTNSHLMSPVLLTTTLLQHRYLLGQLIKRDVLLRYRGAYFGLLWVFLNPLIMLCIFAFVFGYIFNSRWPAHPGSIPYALNLYCGLIAFNIFSETVGRAPAAIRAYPNYVKKIIFPVEILPLVPLGAAFIHGLFNMTILVAALAWTGHLNISLLLFPVLLLPLITVGMGLAWFLSAWGVFIKDMSQIVPIFVQMLMFLSPVFYPVSAVPELYRSFYSLNPLCPIIEALRAALAGASIDWISWGIAFVIGLITFYLGHAFFNHSRDEFADAL
jgi:homopolymeric O-antigen transport system permease protein